jgi:hypothetical protein
MFHRQVPGNIQKQTMIWDASGDYMSFGFPQETAQFSALGVKSVGFHGDNGVTALPDNATTTVFSLPSTSFVPFQPATLICNFFMFPADLAGTLYTTTMTINLFMVEFLGPPGNFNGTVTNQAVADAGMPPGWSIAAVGLNGLTNDLEVAITTTTLGTGDLAVNWNYTFIGTAYQG